MTLETNEHMDNFHLREKGIFIKFGKRHWQLLEYAPNAPKMVNQSGIVKKKKREMVRVLVTFLYGLYSCFDGP